MRFRCINYDIPGELRVSPILFHRAQITINRTQCTGTPKITAAQIRLNSSSRRWQARQGKDKYVADAKVQELKSRAAFKLLEVSLSFLTVIKIY